jgi:hypothetical protein
MFKALSLALGALMCFFVDFIYYGTPTFPPWNFFYVNIVQGAAARYGISQWHWLFSNALPTMLGTATLFKYLHLYVYKQLKYMKLRTLFSSFTGCTLAWRSNRASWSSFLQFCIHRCSQRLSTQRAAIYTTSSTYIPCRWYILNLVLTIFEYLIILLHSLQSLGSYFTWTDMFPSPTRIKIV